MKLKILYSHQNVSGTDNRGRPSWFDFENCFRNFLSTLHFDLHPIELHVVYDKANGPLETNWLIKYKDKCNIHEIEGGTMWKAACQMYQLAKLLSEDMSDDDLFYFVENDYLHQNGWIGEVGDLIYCYSGLNYISLYDHKDKYTRLYPDLVSKIICGNWRHWRTTVSTCGSYIVNKKIFLEDYDILTAVEGDHNKWIHLAETRGRFILSPMPGLSTHCMEGLMSPTVDWELINNKTINK